MSGPNENPIEDGLNVMKKLTATPKFAHTVESMHL